MLHGTSQKWPVLDPTAASTVSKSDPNERAVYVTMRNEAKNKQVETFARQAVAAKGGEPVVAHAKVDTKKGWRPTTLNPLRLKQPVHIESLEDAHDLIAELDGGATGARRGEIWKLLQQGTGMWRNNDPLTKLVPNVYKAVHR